MNVHVFIGNFNTPEEALLYTTPQWEPEPDDSVSDEAYSEWENNNPKWKMETDLNCTLDEDFIETITEDQFNYLNSIVQQPERIKKWETKLASSKAILVLIFEQAISLQNEPLKSTETIQYIGCFESTIPI